MAAGAKPGWLDLVLTQRRRKRYVSRNPIGDGGKGQCMPLDLGAIMRTEVSGDRGRDPSCQH